MTKSAYTSFRTTWIKNRREHGMSRKSIEAFDIFVDAHLGNMGHAECTPEVFNTLYLTKCWWFGNAIHYFIDGGLRNFFLQSVKRVGPEYYISPGSFGCNHPWSDSLSILGFCRPELNTGNALFLHFPSNECSRSIGIINTDVSANDKDNDHAKCYSDGENTWIGCPWKEGNWVTWPYEATENIARIALGFSLYIDAFPEVLRPASNENVHEIKHYLGHTKHTVKTSNIIAHDNQMASSPHYRRGHFVRLSSDCFIHKHGQVIFRKGCFVKGIAYDVLNPEHAPV